jgi:hypothetical protein
MKPCPVSYVWQDDKKRGISPNEPYVGRGLDGGTVWRQFGTIHREDGPAIITDNYEQWSHFGKCHRTDGPAVMYKDGDMGWYVKGAQIFDYDEFQRVTGRTDEEMLLLRLKWGKMYPFDDIDADPEDRY